MKWKIMMVLSLFLLTGRAAAAPTDTASMLAREQIQSVRGSLTGEAAQFMQEIPADGDVGQAALILLERAGEQSRGIWRAALGSLAKLLVIAVICGVLQGIQTVSGGLPVVTLAGALGMTGVFFADLSGMMALCRNTLHEVSVFSKTMLPVMAGAVSLTGAPTTATVMQGITLFSFDLFIRLMTELLLPAVGIYIAILTVDTAVGGGLLGRMAGFLKWAITGSMKITLTLFIAYLTISGVIGGSADALAVKTAKFAVSGSVPVVGGIISDAAESMLAGAVLIRNTLGIFGMLCIVAICLLPFLRVGCNYLLFKAGGAVLTPVCGGALAGLVTGLSDSMGLMLGMLGTCSAILFFELVFSVMMVNPI
ncbi:MAG: stage III sporulation protein AE [Butyricicoccus pullicaecorum]|nr:stage III sporulation protein AE [Butyricicoccus pullicaecorum]MDO4669174.1 stage III sporulation protein AE [Butyricicoccus pullicaecorum]